MASRRAVAQRRQAMVDDIREASRTGSIRPGDMMATVRELSQQYDLSPQTVSLQLRELVDEGLLHTVPRVGVFMSTQSPAVTEPFLMLSPPTDMTIEPSIALRLRIGFEERAAQLGVASLEMPLDLALDSRQNGSLPPLAGVLDASFTAPDFRWEPSPGIPCVRYATPRLDEANEDEVDRVYLDNHNGGRLATHHLVQQGHRTIAFLGLHHLEAHRQHTEFSVHRAAGWAETMAAAGLSSEGLLFTPPSLAQDSDRRTEMAQAQVAAGDLVAREGITAVIGANDHAIQGLFNELRRASIPHERWPAVVGFDGTVGLGEMVTSIRLPWEQLGRVAADMVWDRRTGRQRGPAVRRQIAMTLIPRLSSSPTWTTEGSERMISSLDDRARRTGLDG